MNTTATRRTTIISAVQDDEGYATEIETFCGKNARKEAKAFINNEAGHWTLVVGTQMWNEPVGQTEEN